MKAKLLKKLRKKYSEPYSVKYDRNTTRYYLYKNDVQWDHDYSIKGIKKIFISRIHAELAAYLRNHGRCEQKKFYPW